MPSPTVVYTDGACKGNPGPGGWAWLVPDGPFRSGAKAATTNQQMEVTAALEALKTLPGPLTVVSDSRYVVDCFNQRWYDGWESRGWRNTKKEPVANQDLWRPLVALFHERRHELTFEWVKGHADDPWNAAVDRLATTAAAEQHGVEGHGRPTVTTPERVKEQPVVRAGHHVVILGHRPPELGGYGENLFTAGIRRRLTEILAGLKTVHPDLVVLTGLGLGAEQLGAEAAAAAGVPYVAILPYPDPDEVWPAASRAAYRDLEAGASDTVVLSTAKPASKQAAGQALGRRDAWLLDHADGAIIVWDGEDRPLGDLTSAFERRLPDDTWVVAPAP